MGSIATRLSVAGAVTATGLTMVFWGLERANLIRAEAGRAGTEPSPGTAVLLLLVGGVLLFNLGLFYALTVLSQRRRHHTPNREAPVWLLVVIMVVAGGLGLAAFVAHNRDVSNAVVVSLDVDPMFVAGQVACAMVVVSTLAALGVRWTPRHRPARARR